MSKRTIAAAAVALAFAAGFSLSANAQTKVLKLQSRGRRASPSKTISGSSRTASTSSPTAR